MPASEAKVLEGTAFREKTQSHDNAMTIKIVMALQRFAIDDFLSIICY